MIRSLTSLRAFAAAGLLFYHQMGIIIPVQSDQAFALGVSFFFVLSGFILTINYGDMRRPDLGGFYLARFARLYPVHLFTLIAFGLCFAPTIFFDGPSQGPLWSNALLVQSWVPIRGYIFSMNSVSWSVSAELFFYLCFPLLLWVRRPGPVFAVLVSATLLGCAALSSGGYPINVGPWEFSPAEMVVNTPFFRLAEFACGMWFADLYGRGVLKRTVAAAPTVMELSAVLLVCLFGASGIAIYTTLVGYGVDPLFAIYARVSGGMLLFSALILIMSYEAGYVGRLLRGSPLVLLGETSFALYMVHSIIINVVMIYNLFPDMHWLVRFLVVTCGSYAMSFLVWRFVEKPARRQILSFGARVRDMGKLRTAKSNL